jgi:N-acetylglutamate synthase-like GNAT family acetyltransferase
MRPEIRTALTREANSLLDIDLKSYDYPWPIAKWRAVLGDEEHSVLVACVKAQPVGVCIWRRSKQHLRAEICKLAIKHEYRRHGFACNLLRRVDQDVAELGMLETVVVVPEINCFPGHPDDVSVWLSKQGYTPERHIIRDKFLMYGSLCDGFQFIREVGTKR